MTARKRQPSSVGAGLKPAPAELNDLWAAHNAAWRDPMQVIAHWSEAGEVDPRLLRCTVSGAWWDALAQIGATLLITREYEHLVIALRVNNGEPAISYMGMPHPSGLAVDSKRCAVHVACTRNPNQVLDLAPAAGLTPRPDMDIAGGALPDSPLVPIRARFYPGCLYMHDLAFIGGELHANAVGQNAVVRLLDHGRHERVWWPRCIETDNGPAFGQNYIQLNSIAAGDSVEASYFSASADRLSARRPGHKNFPVDKRGVIFSGATREPMARGLTRPHSARLYNGQVWVDNSGYGEFGFAANGGFTPVARLPGWTRGLCFYQGIAFVGTSRVLPRFRQYAPGLDVDRSVCGVHAIDMQTGQMLGSLIWPYGNQLFAIEAAPFTTGFPFTAAAKRTVNREKRLFYAFKIGE